MGRAATPVVIPERATYHQQYRRCGKARCGVCRRGGSHGPYVYTFWYEETDEPLKYRDGFKKKQHSTYAGKVVPDLREMDDPLQEEETIV